MLHLHIREKLVSQRILSIHICTSFSIYTPNKISVYYHCYQNISLGRNRDVCSIRCIRIMPAHSQHMSFLISQKEQVRDRYLMIQ